MPHFKPFGADVRRFPFWDRTSTGSWQRNLTLTDAKPGTFLPIVMDDEAVQVPIVMYPGTFVGVLNDRDHTDVPAVYRAESPSVLVPASNAAYTLTYNSIDLETNRFGLGTPDLDDSNGAVVAATGATSTSIAATVPLGIVAEPLYSQRFQSYYTNLKMQPQVVLVASGRVIRIPCITANEKLIYPGDVVMVDGGASWNPNGALTTTVAGRVAKYDDAAGKVKYIVGRCIGRHKICSGTASAGTVLLTDIRNDAVDRTSLNTKEGYDLLAREQTVPSLLLQGSATLGVPSALSFARADSNGDYWAIDLALGVLAT